MPFHTRTNPKTGKKEWKWGAKGTWYSTKPQADKQRKAEFANKKKG